MKSKKNLANRLPNLLGNVIFTAVQFKKFWLIAECEPFHDDGFNGGLHETSQFDIKYFDFVELFAQACLHKRQH